MNNLPKVKGHSASGYEEKTITVTLGKRSDYERTR